MGVEASRQCVEARIERIEPRIHPTDECVETSIDMIETSIHAVEPPIETPAAPLASQVFMEQDAGTRAIRDGGTR